MTPEEFYKKLEGHDWFSYMSDDHSVWQRGEVAAAQLKRLAESDPALKSMYDEYRNYVFSGPAFGKEKLPKPPAPSDT